MKSKIALFTALALIAGSAVAADSGFYAGVGMGYGKMNINEGKLNNRIDAKADAFGLDVSNSSVDQFATPYSFFVGYKFMPYLATEIAWIDMGNANYKAKVADQETSTIVGSAKGTWSANGWPVSVLGIWPIDETWSVFGRVGLFMGNVKLDAKAKDSNGDLICLDTGCKKYHASENSNQFMGGVGVDANFMDTWVARLEWFAMPSLGNDDTGSGNYNDVQFSIMYKF